MYSELSTTATGADALAPVGLEVEVMGLFEVFLGIGLEEAWKDFPGISGSVGFERRWGTLMVTGLEGAGFEGHAFAFGVVPAGSGELRCLG